jgi:hypothetical protein
MVELAETTPLIAWSGPVRAATVSEGVVRAPVEETEVVPVPPTAKVLALKFVVEAFEMLSWVGSERVTAPVAADAVI